MCVSPLCMKPRGWCGNRGRTSLRARNAASGKSPANKPFSVHGSRSGAECGDRSKALKKSETRIKWSEKELWVKERSYDPTVTNSSERLRTKSASSSKRGLLRRPRSTPCRCSRTHDPVCCLRPIPSHRPSIFRVSHSCCQRSPRMPPPNHRRPSTEGPDALPYDGRRQGKCLVESTVADRSVQVSRRDERPLQLVG